MDIIQVIRQQIKNGRKETTKLTKKGLEELENSSAVFDEDIEEIKRKSYGEL